MGGAYLGVEEAVAVASGGAEGDTVRGLGWGVGGTLVVFGRLGDPCITVSDAQQGVPNAVDAVVTCIVVLVVDVGDAVGVGRGCTNEGADGQAKLELGSNFPNGCVDAGGGVGGYGVEVVASAWLGVGEEVGEGVGGRALSGGGVEAVDGEPERVCVTTVVKRRWARWKGFMAVAFSRSERRGSLAAR